MSTTTDRSGVWFIRGSAPLTSQSPLQVNDDRQPSTRVPTRYSCHAQRRGRRRTFQTRPSPGSCAPSAPRSCVPPASSRPKAPAITPTTRSSPVTTMPSSPRPAVRRHSGQSRHHAPGTSVPPGRGLASMATASLAPSKAKGTGQRHRQIASRCPLHDPRPRPGAEQATCRISRADRDESVLRRGGRLPSFSPPPSPVISADGPPSRTSEAQGPGPERPGRRGRRRATTQSRRVRRPPSHGRVGTPSPPPELCHHPAAARPSATASKPAQNIQIKCGELTATETLVTSRTAGTRVQARPVAVAERHGCRGSQAT